MAIAMDNEKRCEDCGTVNVPDSKFCKECGGQLPGVAIDASIDARIKKAIPGSGLYFM